MPRPPSSIPDVSQPHRPPARSPETSERRTRRAWWIFASSFFVLGLIAAFRLALEPSPTDILVVALMVIIGFAAIRHRQAVTELEIGRREEAESFARILSSLSRSVSPDAILEAIVAELADASGVDHIVVARRRPDARVLQATLISARPGVPESTTILPIGDLEDPVDRSAEPVGREPEAIPLANRAPSAVGASGFRDRIGDFTARIGVASPQAGWSQTAAVPRRVPGVRQLIADRIAARVRGTYGLTDTLAAPLTSEGTVIGAIVLSHRTAGAWSATTRRLLNGAAAEASSALSRAYSQRAVEAQASTDALTGLPNRRYFDEFCSLLARRRRADDAVGVLMIDLDKFKVLNDTHGHATGDEVLRAVGGAIIAAVREDDVPARYGGEEFVVLLRNPTPEIALDVGERVRAAVAALDMRRLGVRAVSVSVGVAVARHTDQTIDELIAQADRALYRAKRAGRDKVVAA
jgi:diguanylate cyclase (GGDEF)-like protein